MTIKTKDIKAVRLRSRGYCECWCWKKFDMYTDYADWYWPELHHINFRSQYRAKDRDEERNLALLYWPCHKSIHNWNKNLDQSLKAEAEERKPIYERSTEFIKRWNPKDRDIAKKQREKAIEYYKSTHWWMTPTQYRSHKEKIFIKNLKKCL